MRVLARGASVAGIGLLTALQAAGQLGVAILEDDIPGLDHALVERARSALAARGDAATCLTAEQLADERVFARGTQDVLVLTNSPAFPGRARGNVTRFLEAGGHLVLLGGKAYERPMCRVRGQWRDRGGFETLMRETPTATMLFSFDDGDRSGWTRSTNKPEHPSRAVSAPGAQGQCLRLELKGLGQWQWDVFVASVPAAIAEGQDLLCLQARGPAGTPQVAIEIDEADGSRWVRALDITKEWRRYVLEAWGFRFFKDGSPAGRGGPGDCLHLERASRLSFGLATGLSDHPDGDHVIEIDEVGTAANDLGATFGDYLPPNTVCFDDYEPYVLRNAVRAGGCPQDLVVDRGAYEGRVEGLSAVGFTLWERSELVPLLRAEDRLGRNRGWACSALIHYGGTYNGGCWLLSGITTPEFYRSGAFLGCLRGFLQAVASQDLPEGSAQRNARLLARSVPLQTAAPGPLSRSDDGRQFALPDGRPLFLIGCDYIGSLDRKFFAGPWLRWLESDFRRAHEAGLNCLRIYGAGPLWTDPEKLAALKECARKYGIYLLIVVVDHTDLLTRKELEERCRQCAEAFRDEPMLLGYDLQNEPYAYQLAAVEDGEQALGERYPLWKRWGEYEEWAGLQMAGNFTSFPGVTGPLPRNDEWSPVLDATDGIFADWIRWQVEAIRAVDKTHAITVGYNSIFDCLPANRQLDFVSHHAYQPPTDYESVLRNLTTLDRLRRVWPDRPISLGEFGYSNGMRIGDGYLDLHTSALGEFLHYLYAYAHGFSGCMKWALTDHPLDLSRQQCAWIPPEEVATHIEQGRYGLFWSDGTMEAKPKPLVWALRFLREYVDAGGDRGELQVIAAPTQIGTGYVYRAPGALFVGSPSYRGPDLEFVAKQAANVLLRWDDRSLRIVSTADAEARVKASALPGSGAKLKVTGKVGASRQDGEWLGLELLEGEVVEVVG
ncbi:MAG: hypothetical protein FJX75_06150 [Armatimonadetes bacterium]|nr:hypothetical protein [Armatimonadota bacterium]